MTNPATNANIKYVKEVRSILFIIKLKQKKKIFESMNLYGVYVTIGKSLGKKTANGFFPSLSRITSNFEEDDFELKIVFSPSQN